MRLNDPCAVRGHEARRLVVLLATLPPGAQRIEQARGDLAHERTWNCLGVAQDLSRGLVDEANLIRRLDDQDAFAQMLHDVLRQIREIGEIDVFLAHQRFALTHARGEHACGSRDREQHQSQKARACVHRNVRVPTELLPNRVQQNGNCGKRCQEQGAPRRQQKCETAHRDEQQESEAARNAAAGM